MAHYYYTWLDRFFETVKYIICGGIVYAIHILMQTQVYESASTVADVEFFIGDLAIGLAVFGTIRLILDKMLFHCFGLETLLTYDRIMLEDCPGNWTNIMG